MMIRWMLCALLLVGSCSLAAASPEGSLASAAVVQAEDSGDAVEGATRSDRSPLEDLNPAESTWQIWLGPVAIGVFALILALLIRRFSMGSRNRPRDDNDQPSNK